MESLLKHKLFTHCDEINNNSLLMLSHALQDRGWYGGAENIKVQMTAMCV